MRSIQATLLEMRNPKTLSLTHLDSVSPQFWVTTSWRPGESSHDTGKIVGELQEELGNKFGQDSSPRPGKEEAG
jgi:hypothetical protein